MSVYENGLLSWVVAVLSQDDWRKVNLLPLESLLAEGMKGGSESIRESTIINLLSIASCRPSDMHPGSLHDASLDQGCSLNVQCFHRALKPVRHLEHMWTVCCISRD